MSREEERNMLRNIKADFWNMCDLSPRVESVRTQTLSELGGFPEISLGENLSKFSHSIISFRTEVSPSYSKGVGNFTLEGRDFLTI